MSEIWKDIIESIRGTEKDFTKCRISRAILLLSIPMVLEMVMESVFALTDIYFVSRLGSDSVAAVGITESLISFIYAIGGGLSMAATGMIARRIGEKKPEKASIAAAQAIIAGFLVSLFLAVPGIFMSSDILRLMGSENSVIETGHYYTSIMLTGNGIIILLFVNNAIFRSAGDAAISMRVLWFANITNIVLDPCLIFGLGPFPEMGVTGAALATTIGRGTAVIYQFYLLNRGTNRIQLKLRYIIPRINVMYRLLKLSTGGIGQYVIATASWIGLYRIVAEFGKEAVAGYTISLRIVIFALLPSWGLSNAAATLVGQNLGAKKPQRAARSVFITSIVNAIFLLLIALIFITLPDYFIEFFRQQPSVELIGINSLRIISYGFVFYAVGMVITQSFNGAGDTYTPTLLNFICFWLIEIPLAYILSISIGFNEKGVFWAIVIAESMLTIIGIIIFRRGKWKLRKV
jgi:putative MATE family efflux protein